MKQTVEVKEKEKMIKESTPHDESQELEHLLNGTIERIRTAWEFASTQKFPHHKIEHELLKQWTEKEIIESLIALERGGGRQAYSFNNFLHFLNYNKPW